MNKIYLIALLSLLVIPGVGLAAWNDTTIGGTTIITVGGIDLIVSGAASKLDSITVNTSNFTVVMSKGSSLTVTSADRRAFTVDASRYKESFVCGSSLSTLVVANSAVDNNPTITVTPDSGTCSTGGGSPGGGGGISGGGGGGIPTPVYTVIPGTDTSTTAETPEITPIAETTTSAPAAITAIFNTTLKKGMTSDDVKRLQELLATDPEVYPDGIVSGYFGTLTQKAVRAFQAKYDIVSSGTETTTGYGLVGPGTRAKLNEVFGGQTSVSTPASAVAQPSAVATNVSPVFTSGLEIRMENSSVKRLQQLLNSDPDTQIANSGVGSLGNETNYFGSLTEKAVQKFQAKYGVASTGDAGYGYVGPKTRAKLNEVFSGGVQTPAVSAPTTAAPADTSTMDALQLQLQQMLEQVADLQAQLETSQ